MWGRAHKAIFRRGATFRALLHYSRRTVALAFATLPTARWAGKHGARRGPHGSRPPSRRDGAPRLRVVAPHALARSQPAGGWSVRRSRARRAWHRRRTATYRWSRPPASSRDHLQRHRAL